MSPLDFAEAVLKVLPSLVKAGSDTVNLLHLVNASLAQMRADNRGPTDAEWTALNEQIDGLMAQLKD